MDQESAINVYTYTFQFDITNRRFEIVVNNYRTYSQLCVGYVSTDIVSTTHDTTWEVGIVGLWREKTYRQQICLFNLA